MSESSVPQQRAGSRAFDQTHHQIVGSAVGAAVHHDGLETAVAAALRRRGQEFDFQRLNHRDVGVVGADEQSVAVDVLQPAQCQGHRALVNEEFVIAPNALTVAVAPWHDILSQTVPREAAEDCTAGSPGLAWKKAVFMPDAQGTRGAAAAAAGLSVAD